MVVRNLGWIPDLPDHRDFTYVVPRTDKLPSMVDLIPGCPAPYDQTTLRSSTAQALAAALEYDRIRRGLRSWTPSRLMLYYLGRVREGTTRVDLGMQIRTGLKVAIKDGICQEDLWGYDPTKFARKPPARCFGDVRRHYAVAYRRVPRSLHTLKVCLADGFPIICGLTVYESFASGRVARLGTVGVPGDGERCLGGHTVLVVGYDDDSRRFVIRNSWGARWGRRGYGVIPYDYLVNPDLSDDFWMIETVS